MSEVFSRLEAVIQARRHSAEPEGSYVASLLHSGTDRILKKIGEEATEVVIAQLSLQRDVASVWRACLRNEWLEVARVAL